MDYRFQPTFSMWWSVMYAFCETCMRSDSPLCFCDISCTSFITFFLRNFRIINFEGPIHLNYIYSDLKSSVCCNWKKHMKIGKKTPANWENSLRSEYLHHVSVFVCIVSICSMFLYLQCVSVFVCGVFSACFCICLHCEYLQHVSVFVCDVFAACFCVCLRCIFSMFLYLCCEFFQHVSVFVCAMFASCFCICLHCEYLQRISIFALWVFAGHFCICWHCEYLHHISVFVFIVSICCMFLYLFALYLQHVSEWGYGVDLHAYMFSKNHVFVWFTSYEFTVYEIVTFKNSYVFPWHQVGLSSY